MAITFTAISTVEVTSGGGASEALFSNIPNTYTDLYLVISARTTGSGSDATRITLRFNGATTDANLTFRRMYGDGINDVSDSGNQGHVAWANQGNSTASTFSNVQVYIPNYKTSLNKSYIAAGGNEQNQQTAYWATFANRWQDTAAISTIRVATENGENWAQHSTFTLYGITNTI